MSMITDIRSAVSRVFAAPAPMASSGTLMSEIAVERVLTTLMQADDPDLVLSLIQISRADLRRLETDDEVFGALETRRDACINTSWRLEPGQGQVVDFFYDEIRKWGSQIMSIAWTAVPYGYSVGEIVYQRDGGRIVPAKVEEKPIEWFRVDKAGTLRFVGADAGARNSEGDPVDTTLKFLFTRHRPTYKQPYGEAVLSRVYWPWYFRHNGWRFWGQFLERFGMPLLIGKVSDPRSFVALMKELGIDSVIAVNQTSEVTAVPVTGQGEFKDFEAVVCRRIQKAILGQTLTTDAASSGSYALGQVHELVRQDRRLADIRIVSDTMQRWINAMTALNFPAAEPPQFVMEDGRGLEVDRATRDAALANAGIAKFSEDYLRRVYDFEEGDVAVPADKPIAPVLSARAGSFAAGHPFARRRFTAQQEQIDRLAENAIGDLASPIDPKLVRAAVLAATSPDDLADRLATLMTDADPAEYRETLEQALFAADVIGYVHATEQGDR